MSEPIPESIPISRDASGRPPPKKKLKRALTPTSLQAATLSTLMSKVDQPILIPPSSTTGSGSGSSRPALAAPPEIVANVQGSSAGAGSGEFHVYKASRRREYERMKQMDEEVRREKEGEEFERGKRERERKDEERTRRNREKRMRKQNKGAKGGGGKDGPGLAERGGAGGAGVKGPRVDGAQDEGDEGADAAGQDGEGWEATQEIGLVIHDDD